MAKRKITRKKPYERPYERGNKVSYTPDVARQMILLKKEGMKNHEIADRLGVNRATFNDWLRKELNVPYYKEMMALFKDAEKENEENYWHFIGMKIVEAMSQGMNESETAFMFGVTYDTLKNWVQKPEVQEFFQLALTAYEAYWTRIGREGIKQGKDFNGYTWIFNVTNRSRIFPSGRIWSSKVEVDANVNANVNELLSVKATQERILKIQIQESLRELEAQGVISINKPEALKQIEESKDGSTSTGGEGMDQGRS